MAIEDSVLALGSGGQMVSFKRPGHWCSARTTLKFWFVSMIGRKSAEPTNLPISGFMLYRMTNGRRRKTQWQRP